MKCNDFKYLMEGVLIPLAKNTMTTAYYITTLRTVDHNFSN